MSHCASPPGGRSWRWRPRLQESGLRNLTFGDHDSLGLFQQRPSQGWGTAEQILDPVHTSTRFYEALENVSGWQSLTVGQAAQAVQKSAFPDAYAKWEPLATALQKAIGPLLTPAGGTRGSASSGSGGPVAVSAAGGCAADGDGSDFGVIPPGAVPAGYTIPADAPATVQTAIRWSLGQLGTDYQWPPRQPQVFAPLSPQPSPACGPPRSRRTHRTLDAKVKHREGKHTGNAIRRAGARADGPPRVLRAAGMSRTTAFGLARIRSAGRDSAS